MSYQVAGCRGGAGGADVGGQRQPVFVSSGPSPSPSPAAAVPPGQELTPFISPQTQKEAQPLNNMVPGRVVFVF